MGQPDYYRINIAKLDFDNRYHHWAYVVIEQTYPVSAVKEKFEQIKQTFPMPEYNVSITYEKHRGEILNW